MNFLNVNELIGHPIYVCLHLYLYLYMYIYAERAQGEKHPLQSKGEYSWSGDFPTYGAVVVNFSSDKMRLSG